MLISYLPYQDLWVVIILWSLYYYGDYCFTVFNSKNYPPVLGRHFVHKGSFEIDTRLQDDIDNGRWFSLAFLRSWIITCMGFLMFWWLSGLGNFPQLFQWYSGLLFLLFGVSYLRHFRNFSSYKFYNKGDIIGKVEYTESYDLTQSAWELIGFSLFYLLISVILGSWFFFGGFVSSIFLATNHRKMAKKASANKKILT